jgi:hypothetical protein
MQRPLFISNQLGHMIQIRFQGLVLRTLVLDFEVALSAGFFCGLSLPLPLRYVGFALMFPTGFLGLPVAFLLRVGFAAGERLTTSSRLSPRSG